MNRTTEKENRKGDGSRALALAEIIIQNSPSILFRRLAADDPKQRKMVYVSPNISRFGYSADDFLNGTIMFREIVYQGGSDRTLKEIKEFVGKESENYSQVYHIITKFGEVRWVEDQTSIYVDPESGIRYHQGIVTDIHERMVAEEKLRKEQEKVQNAIRCLNMAIDMQLKMKELNKKWFNSGIEENLKIRCGINTGMATF